MTSAGVVCRRRYNDTCDDGCTYDYDMHACLPYDLAGDAIALAEFLAQLYTYDMRAYGECKSPALTYKKAFSDLCGDKRRKLCGTGGGGRGLLPVHVMWSAA